MASLTPLPPHLRRYENYSYEDLCRILKGMHCASPDYQHLRNRKDALKAGARKREREKSIQLANERASSVDNLKRHHEHFEAMAQRSRGGTRKVYRICAEKCADALEAANH